MSLSAGLHVHCQFLIWLLVAFLLLQLLPVYFFYIEKERDKNLLVY
jgi:hypothetical protein